MAPLTNTALLLIATMTICSSYALGQPAEESRRVVVRTRDGRVESGYLLSAENDSLRYMSSGAPVSVATGDIVRIDRLISGYRGMGEFGLALGFYSSVTWIVSPSTNWYGRDNLCEECRRGYLSGGSGLFLLAFSGVLPTGIIGYSIDEARRRSTEEEDRETFDLDSDPERRKLQLEELSKRIESSSLRRWSLSVRGGSLLLSAFDDAFESPSSGLGAAGYRTRRLGAEPVTNLQYGNHFFNDNHALPSTPFLWARRAALHYRLVPEVDVGASIVNLSVPGSAARRDDTMPEGIRGRSFAEGVSGFGYMAGVRYVPFVGSRFGRGLAIVGGIGPASLDFHRIAYDELISPDRNHTSGTSFEQREAHTAVAGLVAVEFTLPLSPMTSLGLYADYVATTPVTLPGLPELNVPDRTVTAGSLTAGFALGWSF